MERKPLMDAAKAAADPAVSRVKILLVGRSEAECIELQAACVSLQGVAVETVTTIAQLPATLQKSASAPDIILVGIDPNEAGDLALLRDLRKIRGVDNAPLIAVLGTVTDNAPLRAMRAGANDVLLKPINPDEARDVFTHLLDQQRPNRTGAATLGKTIVFMHLSGGAGATTLAVNAACALARAPKAKEVGLLDLDIQFGNAANLLDLPAASPMQDFLDDPRRLDPQMLESMMLRHASGLHVLTAPRTLLPFNAFAVEGIRTMLDLARQRFGYSILDLPVALTPWTETVLKSASVIYLVAPLSVPSAHRLVKFLELLRDEGMGDLPLKLIANRYHRGNKGNDIPVGQFQKATAKKIDYLIPNDYSLISMSHGQGQPAVRLKPNSPFTLALTQMLSTDLGKDVFGEARRGLFSFRKA